MLSSPSFHHPRFGPSTLDREAKFYSSARSFECFSRASQYINGWNGVRNERTSKRSLNDKTFFFGGD